MKRRIIRNRLRDDTVLRFSSEKLNYLITCARNGLRTAGNLSIHLPTDHPPFTPAPPPPKTVRVYSRSSLGHPPGHAGPTLSTEGGCRRGRRTCWNPNFCPELQSPSTCPSSSYPTRLPAARPTPDSRPGERFLCALSLSGLASGGAPGHAVLAILNHATGGPSHCPPDAGRQGFWGLFPGDGFVFSTHRESNRGCKTVLEEAFLPLT